MKKKIIIVVIISFMLYFFYSLSRNKENTLIKHGKHREYGKNGELLWEADFKNDTIDGLYKSYYSNGQIKTLSYFKMGLRDSSLEEYDENGHLLSFRFFQNDTAVYIKKYDVSGNLIWYGINATINQTIKDDSVYLVGYFPTSNVNNNFTALIIFNELSDGTLDTIYIDYEQGLSVSFGLPAYLYEKADSLVANLCELDKNYNIEMKGYVPLTYKNGLFENFSVWEP